MHVLFVTSEVATLFKLGGLGDVSYALPIALSRLGIQVDIALPYYEKIPSYEKTECLGMLAVDYKGKREIVFIFQAKLGNSSVRVLFFRHPRLDDYYKEQISDTFAFFSRAVSAFFVSSHETVGYEYDIVHCQDWHTALIPLMLGEQNKTKSGKVTIQAKRAKTILTIHNLLYQGVVDATLISRLQLPRKLFHVYRTNDHYDINILREGLEYADVITTVSPTYAKEILTSDYGEHINNVLARRKDHVIGILNGISSERWNPKTDEYIWQSYDVKSVVSLKKENKRHLQNVFRIPTDDVLLFGYVSRLEAWQKGIELVEKVVASSFLEKKSAQLVVLGTGPREIVTRLELLAKKHASHFSFIHTFDERLARRIYAGADVLLVPSKFEPCGLTQLIAMRYGTIPLVRNTGGLADTVEDTVTGFVFDNYQSGALTKKMEEAIVFRQEHPKKWRAIIERIMRKDIFWKASAKEYVRLYKRLIKR